MKKFFYIERGTLFLKRVLAFILTLIFLLQGCSAKGKIDIDYDFSSVISRTMTAAVEAAPDPKNGSVYGEWCIINGVRSGEKISSDWYDKYYNNLCRTLEEVEGKLSSTKNTEYSRVLIALTAIGKDITNVAGYDLLDNYMMMEDVTRQGLSGPIFALIALDCGGYELPEGSDVSREALVDFILDEEFENGGWAIIGSEPDADITSQALQALSPYLNDERVSSAVERAVLVLSEMQNEKGGFSGWRNENSQTNAQVIIALSSLGIDVRTDERFLKGENWLGSYIMSYYLGDGQFENMIGNGYDPMATDQCLQALICITRFDNGESRFYDFSDLK